MRRVRLFFSILLVLVPLLAAAEAMTEFGTPRNETLIVQSFDSRSSAPDTFNWYLDRDLWHGARMLCYSYLWETDTSNGAIVNELAAEAPILLDNSYTNFRIKLRPGIYWSDGVEFTADDVMYTCEMTRKNIDKLPNARLLNMAWKSIAKVDKYTVDVVLNNKDYYFAQNWGVWTWGPSMLCPLPKHLYEKQADISQFKDSQPLALGAYTLYKFDPNGSWHIWKLRDDWQRSSWRVYNKTPKVKYIVYMNAGPEDKQTLAFMQNKLDAATFMSWDNIKAVQKRNKDVKTFADKFPYFWNDDACAFSLTFNQQKAPFNDKDIRWGLALVTDVKAATIASLGGAFRVSAVPMVAQSWMKTRFFDPLMPWLQDFALDDGYKPFNRNFPEEMKAELAKRGEKNLPAKGLETDTLMGMGWWKYDPAEAEKLFLKAGMKRNADRKWCTPDGKVWKPVLAFPSDWHTILQRMGFSIADSWKKFGIDVVAKQVDNAEYGKIQNYNNMLDAYLGWPGGSYLTPVQFMQNLRQKYLLPADSNTAAVANLLRWDNKDADRKIEAMLEIPSEKPEAIEAQREILKMMISDMADINISDIPTTIPENWHYWKNWPTANNYYATPLTWWSCFKVVVMNLEPTGAK
jgi:peptide/nickel transport system substrate-binding protein